MIYHLSFLPVLDGNVNFNGERQLEAFAGDRGHKVSELAIAWLLSPPWLSTVIAGATRPDQLDANLAAAGWKLTEEEVAQVEKI